MSAPSPARQAAFDILLEVEQSRAHCDDLLRARRIRKLSEPDRNLTQALVLGVLRWQLALDKRIRPLLSRPNAKLDAEIRIALRLAAFQMQFFDRIPARAAIDESVELTKSSGHRFAAGMVNAVLRKLAQAERAPLDPAEAYPAWMLVRWQASLGKEAAAQICANGLEPPPASIRLTDAKSEEALRAAGLELAPGVLLGCARTVLKGEIATTDAFRAGSARIQDEGSQLIAELATVPNQNIKKILDACAAPGGKTLILAERNPKSNIVACESSPQRHAALLKRLAPLAARVQCLQADAALLKEDAVYDAALVDAPCSGTGTLARNPEIRHRLAESDFARQSARQQAILSAALRAVRPDGTVLYSTCSLEPEENEAVVAAALHADSRARVLPVAERIAALDRASILAEGAAEKLHSAITPDGFLRLTPGVFACDGFFVALLVRQS